MPRSGRTKRTSYGSRRLGVGQRPLERRGVAHGAELVLPVEFGELLLVPFAPAGHQDPEVRRDARVGVREARALAVVDPRVVRDDAAPARRARPVVEVGLLAVAASEDLVEDAERPDDLATHEEAEADDRRRVGIARGARSRDAAREREDVGAGRELHGEVHGARRERAAEADRRILLAARHHPLEGSLGEERVRVEETDPRRVGEEKAAVRGLHETEIHLVFEEDDSTLRPQELRRPVVAPVVDDDDAGPGWGEPAHALEAVACRAERVVDRDDEVAAHAGGWNRHRFRSSLSFHHGVKRRHARERFMASTVAYRRAASA